MKNIFRRPKVCNMIDREPVVVFTQKSVESDQSQPTKIRFKEMKRREMSRTAKNEIILTCSCANKFGSDRLKSAQRLKDYLGQTTYLQTSIP